MSKRGVVLCVIGAVLIAAFGYAGGLLVARAPAKAGTQGTDFRSDVWDDVPRVDGEIKACLPSPDYSRVAIYYWKWTPLCPRPVVAIIDPATGKTMGETHPSVGAPSAPFTWSPDSKWLTIPEEDRELRMIGRDGSVRLVPTGRVVGDIVWREEQPDKFLYTCSRPCVYEYDLSKQSQTSIRTEFKYAERLFTVNGKPCVTGIAKDGGTRAATVRLVDTGEAVSTLAAPDNGDYQSLSDVEISPDSRFVALTCRIGMRDVGIIARAQDWETVIRDRSRALYVAEQTAPYFRVVWPANETDTTALVNGQAVDIRDGCLKAPQSGAKRLAHWKPITKKGKHIPRWLELGRYGLVISADDGSVSKVPILAHTVIGDNF